MSLQNYTPYVNQLQLADTLRRQTLLDLFGRASARSLDDLHALLLAYRTVNAGYLGSDVLVFSDLMQAIERERQRRAAMVEAEGVPA